MRSLFLLVHMLIGISIIPFTFLVRFISGRSLDTHPLSTMLCITAFVSVVNVLNSCLFQPMIDWSHNNQVLSRIRSGLYAMLIGILVWHLLAVIFGAPMRDSFYSTLVWAVLMSALCVLPAGLLIGSDIPAWKYLFLSPTTTHTLNEMSCYWGAVGAIFGAWLGAIPIPLDWDRPWQVWPISCTYGALGGYILGMVWASIYGFFQNYGF